MIKGNELDIANIGFELQAKTGDKFLRFTLFSNVNEFTTSLEKVYFRSQILERPSIVEYWNISGVPVLPENVIFTFFRTCWCYSEAYNTGTQKWSSIVQYSCTSIWDLKYTFSPLIVSQIKISRQGYQVSWGGSYCQSWHNMYLYFPWVWSLLQKMWLYTIRSLQPQQCSIISACIY